jgi:hypothetical protein
MNVEIGTETPIFLFWEYLFRNFKFRHFVFAVCSVQAEDYSELNMFISIFTGEHFYFIFSYYNTIYDTQKHRYTENFWGLQNVYVKRDLGIRLTGKHCKRLNN